MNNDINRIKEMKRDFIDAMIGYGVQYETCGKISAALNAAIESLAAATTPPVLAAPANSAVLPELPDHPEPQVMKWSELEKKAIRTYGQACAAAALAASAPKVQMTDLEIIEIATATRTAESNKDGGYILPISFARAILARSAPNAELVAALKAMVADFDGCYADAEPAMIKARAALAAAGEA